MANSTINNLTENTSPAVTDVLAMGGTPDAQKVTIATLLSLAYPVGTIYTSTTDTNPGTLFGVGTWSAFGAGKVLVGLDTNDTSFDTVEETGGAKTVASAGTVSQPTFAGDAITDVINHTHTVNITDNGHTHTENAPSSASGGTAKFGIDTNASGSQSAGVDTASATTGITATTANPAGGVASVTPTGTISTPTFTGSATSVLQPYIVVYFFKRTA